uniref:striatin-interacting protein 1 homolog n=1 Tax=Ciona intestinalis TaxID=7719 RepID=UPI000180C855|nr:striatin-interacting protein 1 homolog [Ciona intestinalis]|eukprot:XP_002130558.1 striatin-interacting protein 1 homolog [Ciona intestinalis]
MANGNAKETEADLEFLYDDSDAYAHEISELYTYSEEAEFQFNKDSFAKLLKSRELDSWAGASQENRTALVMHIVQTLDVLDKNERFEAVRWTLYLVQGAFGECKTAEEQRLNCRENCFLLYKLGIFSIVQELLMMEINSTPPVVVPTNKKTNLLSLSDSLELRSLMIIIYTMVETLRRENEDDSNENVKLRKEFYTELEQGLNDKEPLVITLFNMVCKFSSQTTSILPMKKVLLLLWKLLLTLLGGYSSLHNKMEERRKELDLPLLEENPLKIIREMRASVPPTSAADLLDISQAGKRRGRKSILYDLGEDNSSDNMNNKEKSNEPPLEEEKVTSIDDEPLLPPSGDKDNPLDETNGVVKSEPVEPSGAEGVIGTPTKVEEAPVGGAMTPMPTQTAPTLTSNAAAVAAKIVQLRREQQAPDISDLPHVKVVSGLPWTPKARKKDVELFLNQVRQKFIGFSLPGDLTTVAGLPKTTKDSLKILRKHTYVPMSDLQIAKEVEMTKCPLTIGKQEVISTGVTERLYQAMLPHIPQYMIALLKILLAAAPTSKAKNDSINILADVLPQEMLSTVVASLRLGIDVNRHREIIVKSISGMLLLLLKHFKLNHVYQFEYMSQHLVFANCIPLVLKFFNQNIVAYVTTKNMIPSLEFPACVIGEKSEITAETFDGVDSNSVPCWRNLFSSINLLRILNKLVKWKHSRTMMLVVFKSAPILKRALKVRQAMFQLYVLKLLKVQTKYLGRAWRKSNMKTMSAIYQKVRHRLHDDWAFGNDVDAQPWDFQQEECALRNNVERFNVRRYGKGASALTNSTNIPTTTDEYTPVENNLQNLLKEEVELPVEFRKSYDVWLEREVYYSNTDWDQLLTIPCVQ